MLTLEADQWLGMAGGLAEAQAAYDEAVNAVFNLQVECHRHAQPHLSRKDSRTKWAMIEMWPMQVQPVNTLCIVDSS